MPRRRSGVPPSTASIAGGRALVGRGSISSPRRTTSSSASVSCQRAGGGQRAELAERVAGGRRRAATSSVRLAGEAGAEDRGLREAGARPRRGQTGPRRRARWQRSSRSGRRRATLSRMSAVWLPWPGRARRCGRSRAWPSRFPAAPRAQSGLRPQPPDRGGRPLRPGGSVRLAGDAAPVSGCSRPAGVCPSRRRRGGPREHADRVRGRGAARVSATSKPTST